MAAAADKELEDSLMEVGARLASPPSDADELFNLLDKTENFLSRVDQSPSPSMSAALRPAKEALVAKNLLEHLDMDVKVAVASCVSEITRITAPDAPYDDDLMKVIFQMIVEAFEKLDDISSRSHMKRVSILETVAKVRSCVVMLDLECDALILEMFRYFLKTIRSTHSDNVFSSMEMIMILVLEESEDISSELLSCLLDSVKKDKEVLPIAHRLGEKVISSCAGKLKPYLMQVQSLSALCEHSQVVASICQENSDALEQNETNISGENLVDDNKLSERTVSEELPQGSVKTEQEAGSPENVATADKSPIPVMSNGTIQKGDGESGVEPVSPNRKPERSLHSSQSKNNVAADRADSDNLEPMDVEPDTIQDLKTKKTKGRKTNSSIQVTDTSEYSRNDSDKETPSVPSKITGSNKEADSPRVDGPSGKGAELTVSVEPEDKKDLLPPHKSDNGSVSLPSPTPSEDVLDTNRPRRGRPSGSKVSVRRGVNDVADQPASTSGGKGALRNNQPQDELLPSEDKDFKKDPKVVRDSEGKSGVPLSSPTLSENVLNTNRPRRGRPPGSKVSAKRGVSEVADQPASTSGEKGAPQNSETRDELLMSEDNDIKKVPKAISNSEGKSSVSLLSPTPSEDIIDTNRPRRGRPAGSKASVKRGVNEVADQPASTSGEKETLRNSQTQDELLPSEDNDFKKDPKVVSSSEEKSRGRPGKKVHSETDDAEKPASLRNDFEAKSAGQTGKRGPRKKVKGGSSGKNQKSYIKQTKENISVEKDADEESSLKGIPSPKSETSTQSKDESQLVDNVKTQSRRKRSRAKEEMFETPDHKLKLDESLVGSNIKVWWPDDNRFYDGRVDSFDAINEKHTIVYDDGDTEVLLLKEERIELSGDGNEIEGLEQAKDIPGPLSPPQVTPNKKAKRSSGSVPKQGKTPVPIKSVKKPMGRPKGGGSSSKSKEIPASKSEDDTPKSSGGKFKGPGKKSKEDTPKLGKVGDGASEKHVTPKTSKSKDYITTSVGKSKDETPKSGRKSKDDTPKTSSKFTDDSIGQGDKIDTPKAKSSQATPKAGRKMKHKGDVTPKSTEESPVDGTSKKGKEKIQPSATPKAQESRGSIRKKQKGDVTPNTTGESPVDGTSMKGKEKVQTSETPGKAQESRGSTGKKRNRKGNRK